MRVAYVSNYLNEHTLPVADRLALRLGEGFSFVTLEDHVGNLGKSDVRDRAYARRASQMGADELRGLVLGADVVLFGHMGAREDLVDARAREGGVFLRMTERLLKRGLWWRFAPPKALRTWRRFTRYRTHPCAMLCAGAFAPADLARSGFPLDQCYDWGYFPELATPTERLDTPRDDGALRLIWAGRMLDWKRPMDAIETALRLRGMGVRFSLEMAGDGPEREHVQELVDRSGLAGCVSLLGALSRDELAGRMLASDVLLLTSDRHEGWGAVLGEAMQAGCVPVASSMAGATHTLVTPGVEGLVFEPGDVDAIARHCATLAADPAARERMSRMARARVQGTWSADAAATNLVTLIEAMLDGHPCPVEEGPCAPVSFVRDDWFRRRAHSGGSIPR